jgi:hypothetical protein
VADDAAAKLSTMRKINIGVSVAPPTWCTLSPYVAKDLGFSPALHRAQHHPVRRGVATSAAAAAQAPPSRASATSSAAA